MSPRMLNEADDLHLVGGLGSGRGAEHCGKGCRSDEKRASIHDTNS